MKKYLLVAIVLLLVATVAWCIIMDPVSVRQEDIASIEVRYTNYRISEFGKSEAYEDTFTITDENAIHYICDALNGILPIPGASEYCTTYQILTLRRAGGEVITEVKLLANDYIVTDKGTFQADVGELNRNIYNIRDGEDIVTNMMFLPLLLIGWLIVIIFSSLAGLILFLIQMGICAKTDSLALRLLPSIILITLCLFGFRTQFLTGAFYIASLLAFNDPWIGAALISGAAVLFIVLGWCQGHSMLKTQTTNIK